MENANRGEFSAIAEHMRNLGLGALAHANWHAAYMSWQNDYWPQLSVLQGAHAAELLVKARIAEEHPLLIFEHLPRSSNDDDHLSLQRLIEAARTVQYSDLPDRLWASTGITIPNVEQYLAFGRLRNTLQHFMAPEAVDFSSETLSMIYSVIDPFIHEHWGLYAIDFNEDHDPYIYLMGGLIRRGITFLVSPGAAEDFGHVDAADWEVTTPTYRMAMETRVAHAVQGQPPSD